MIFISIFKYYDLKIYNQNTLRKEMSIEVNKIKKKKLIIDELRKITGFIEFKDSSVPIKKSSVTTINDLAILSSISAFDINSYDESSNGTINKKDIKTVGMIILPTNKVDIFVYKCEYSDEYYLQFDDLPITFWYRVNKVNDLAVFVKYYIDNNVDIHKKIKTVRYDLRRNDMFHHIMIERYMLISRYLEKTVHGTECIDDYVNYAKQNYGTFDIATKYYDESLRQIEDETYVDIFELSSYSLYSNSYITLQKTLHGVVVQITYTSSNCFSKLINIINEHIGSTFNEDLPLDVVMFLLPFAPIDQRYLLSLIENDIKITMNLISMLLWLRTDIIDDPANRTDTIKILRLLHEKINSNTNDYEEDERILLQSRIKRCINREYIELVYQKLKQQNSIQLNNEDKIQKSVENEKKIDGNTVLDNILKIMMENSDEKYIDSKFIKNVFKS